MASVTTWLPVPAPAPSRRLSREDAVNAEMKMQFSEGGGGTAAIACHASSVWQVWNDAAGNANADTADLFGILATHEADAQVDTHTTSGAVSAQDKAARKAGNTNGKSDGDVVSPSSSVGPSSCFAAAITNNIKKSDMTAEDGEDEGEDVAHGENAEKKTLSTHFAHEAMDDDEREKDRKKRNRESAKLSRARKRVRQENILSHVRELEEANARLSNELAAAYAKLRELSNSADGRSANADEDNKGTAKIIQLEEKVKCDTKNGVDVNQEISPAASPAAPIADATSNEEGEVGQRCGDRETGGSKTSGPVAANDNPPCTCAYASVDAHVRVTRKRAILEGHHESAVLIVNIMTLAWFNTAFQDCLRRLSTRVTSPRGMALSVRLETDMVSNKCEPSVIASSTGSFSSVSQSSTILSCITSILCSRQLSTTQAAVVAESARSSASCKKKSSTLTTHPPFSSSST